MNTLLLQSVETLNTKESDVTAGFTETLKALENAAKQSGTILSTKYRTPPDISVLIQTLTRAKISSKNFFSPADPVEAAWKKKFMSSTEILFLALSSKISLFNLKKD